ncbi:hypothetical protein [Streptomyces sp. NPDC050585]|uniref:hypothetical protein n=1 Tax=Streptomyces sp. NPDC050585 TaxID=3365632 RepID=UPI00379F7897
MRDDVAAILAGLRTRTDRWFQDTDPSGVLDDQALEDFGRLLDLMPETWPGGPPTPVLSVLAHFLWGRHLARPEELDGDLEAGTALFALLYPREPAEVPEQLRPLMATVLLVSADPMAWGPLVASAVRSVPPAARGTLFPAPVWQGAPDDRPRLPNGADRAAFLSQCGNEVGTLFEQSAARTDLDDSVRLCDAAVTLAGPGHPNRVALLQNLAVALVLRARHARSHDALSRAIDVRDTAIAACAPDEPVRATLLASQGMALQYRYDQLGRLDDLQRAVTLYEDSLRLGQDDTERATVRSLLSVALLRRFETLGDTADLDRGALLGRQALDGLPAAHPGRPVAQAHLGVVLRTRHERTGRAEDVEEALGLLHAALDSMPADHPDRSITMANLGNAYVNRSMQHASVQDLDEGIKRLRSALALVPPGDPEPHRCPGMLGGALYRRFLRLQEGRDIDEAIDSLQAAADTVPPAHVDRRPLLNALGTALQTRYTATGADPGDLERAHRTYEECLRITPVGGPDHSGVLSNLASVLHLRSERGELPGGVSEAIRTIESAVDTAAPDHPARTSMLVKLSLLLRSRFHAENRLEDLDRAVRAAGEALRARFSERPDRAHEALALAHALTDRFLHNATTEDALAAVAHLRDVARTPTANVDTRLHAARSAGILTATVAGRPAAAVDDYDVVELIPLLAWHGLGRSTRERLLGHWSGLVCEATSASIDAGRLERAVEQLEQGRAVLWGQLLETRGDLTKLRAGHPELAQRLTNIRVELDQLDPSLPEEEAAFPPLEAGAHRPSPPRLLSAPRTRDDTEKRDASVATAPHRPRPTGTEALRSLTEAVLRRISDHRAERDPAPVLDARAPDEARLITELVREGGHDPVVAMAAEQAVAWLRYHRGAALGGEHGKRESVAAREMFERIWGVPLEEIAPTLVDAVAVTDPSESGTMPEGPGTADPGPTVTELLAHALRSREPGRLAGAAADLQRLAGLLADDDPFRPLAAVHAATVRLARYAEAGEEADREEAVRCARAVLGEGAGPVPRLVALSVLVTAFLRAGDADAATASGHIHEAVGMAREAAALATSLDEAHPSTGTYRARRMTSLLQLGQALMARYRAWNDAPDLDHAVMVCLEMAGLLTSPHPDHPGARRVIASVLEEVNRQSGDRVRLAQSLLLCRALLALTGMPTPSETSGSRSAGGGPGTPETGRPHGSEPSAPPPADGPQAETYATGVTIGSATVAATTVADTDPDRYLATVRRIRGSGGVVLVPERPSLLDGRPEGGPEVADLECLVETVGDCAAVPLRAFEDRLTGSAPGPGRPLSAPLDAPVFPCLLSGHATLHTVLAQSGLPLPDDVVTRARPVRTDFREWEDLWADDMDDTAVTAVMERLRRGDARYVLAYAIGELLATGHSGGTLHGDARWENFAWAPERGTAVFTGHDLRFLCRPPSPAQCATDLVPLLPSLTPSTWYAFRLGYGQHWLGGRRVIDLMEYGDSTGWMLAMHRQEPAAAVRLLSEALDRCEPDDEAGRMVVTANRAEALSRIGRHAEACADADAAWKAGRALAPEVTPLLALRAGLVWLRAGDRDAAFQTFLRLAIGAGSPLVSELALRTVQELADGVDRPALLEDVLPYIARKGSRVVAMTPAGQGGTGGG